MRIRSSLSSGPSLSRMLSRMPILPTSWSRPAHLIFSISVSGSLITRHMASAMWLTRFEWPRVYWSRASTALARAPIVCSNSSRVST